MKTLQKNSTALITGASSGLGAAFAVYLAQKGLNVFLAARREDRLKSICQKIEESGGNASYLEADLSSEKDRELLFQKAKAKYKTIDYLVNNAGFGWYGYYEDMPWETARKMAEVNMMAVVHLTKLCLPSMRKNERGHIINIGSIAGGLPNQGIAMYSASKAFMDAFTVSLYRELRGSGVHTSVMRLGPVKTEFYDQARKRKNGRSIPAEKHAITTEQVNKALWRLMKHPRRAIYVPGWLVVSRYVENSFGGIIDLLGPLLLKRGDKEKDQKERK